MLAIPHLSQVSSMAEIVSKEAQKKSKAGICFRSTSHNKHTLFLSLQRSTSCKSKTSAINRAFCGSSQTDAAGSSQGGGFSSQAVGVSSQGGSGSSQVVAESLGQKKVKRAKQTVTWFNP
ncbi:hypothetical protein Tco_0266051 [Tanacetum coccineum]